MKIIVCIKQVPGTSQVEIDPETGVLKRDGVESKMNPYDLYALETALRFKQEHNAEMLPLPGCGGSRAANDPDVGRSGERG